MGFCAAIKPNGARCRAQAMRDSQWCYVHAPELAEERHRNNKRGGLVGGRGRPKDEEIKELKRLASELYAGVLECEIPPNVAAVGVQALNVRARLWESERRVRLREAEVVTQEQLRNEVAQAAEVVTRHVTDRSTLAAIRDDLRRLDEARRHAP